MFTLPLRTQLARRWLWNNAHCCLGVQIVRAHSSYTKQRYVAYVFIQPVTARSFCRVQ